MYRDYNDNEQKKMTSKILMKNLLFSSMTKDHIVSAGKCGTSIYDQDMKVILPDGSIFIELERLKSDSFKMGFSSRDDNSSSHPARKTKDALFFRAKYIQYNKNMSKLYIEDTDDIIKRKLEMKRTRDVQTFRGLSDIRSIMNELFGFDLGFSSSRECISFFRNMNMKSIVNIRDKFKDHDFNESLENWFYISDKPIDEEKIFDVKDLLRGSNKKFIDTLLR